MTASMVAAKPWLAQMQQLTKHIHSTYYRTTTKAWRTSHCLPHWVPWRSRHPYTSKAVVKPDGAFICQKSQWKVLSTRHTLRATGPLAALTDLTIFVFSTTNYGLTACPQQQRGTSVVITRTVSWSPLLPSLPPGWSSSTGDSDAPPPHLSRDAASVAHPA